MNFLKNLFSGGSSNQGDGGLYFYVRPRGCEEVVQVRLNPSNDLSRSKDGGFFVVKSVRGKDRCFNPAEMTLHFNNQRKLIDSSVSGGKLVDEEAYNAYQQARAEKKQAIREQNANVDAAQASGDDRVDDVVRDDI